MLNNLVLLNQLVLFRIFVIGVLIRHSMNSRELMKLSVIFKSFEVNFILRVSQTASPQRF